MTNKNTSFGDSQTITLAVLLLAAALAFAGCATTKNPAPGSPPTGTPHSEKILLREGDVLKIAFPGAPNLDTIQPIRRDGKLNLTLVGEVQAAGLTPDELQKKLVDLYASQISSKEITVQVQSSVFPVYITGAVIKPGKITSDHPITVLEAVMEAGGPNYDTANLKSVHIDRNENGVMRHFIVNLKAMLVGTDMKPFYLKPADIVYVPEKLSPF